jgi:hypothetical protein
MKIAEAIDDDEQPATVRAVAFVPCRSDVHRHGTRKGHPTGTPFGQQQFDEPPGANPACGQQPVECRKTAREDAGLTGHTGGKTGPAIPVAAPPAGHDRPRLGRTGHDQAGVKGPRELLACLRAGICGPPPTIHGRRLATSRWATGRQGIGWHFAGWCSAGWHLATWAGMTQENCTPE